MFDRLYPSPVWFLAGFLVPSIVGAAYLTGSEDLELIEILVDEVSVGLLVTCGAAVVMLVGKRYFGDPKVALPFIFGLLAHVAIKLSSTVTIDYEEYFVVFPAYMLFLFGCLMGSLACLAQHVFNRLSA